MKAQFLHLHPQSPESRKIAKIITVLQNGGLVIYPTDSVYGVGCDLFNKKAVARLLGLIKVKPKEINLSFICHSLSEVSLYARHISTPVYKVMKKALPGPYTFILKSSSRVPRILGVNKKTVGIRIPDNNIPLSIVRELGNPIISASIKDEDKVIEYSTDPELIYDRFKDQVDSVIHGGMGGLVPTTILECIDLEVRIVRSGAGKLESIL